MTWPETHWHLFVDESGDFDRPEGQVVVAGVGLRLDRVATRPDQLKAQLVRLVPGMPWPLHLCVVKRPSALALAPMALRIRAVAEVAGRQRRALRAGLDAVEHGLDPRAEDMDRIRDLLESVAGCPLGMPVAEALARHAHQWRALLEAEDPVAASPPSLWSDPDLFLDKTASAMVQAARHLLSQSPDGAARTARALVKGEPVSWDDWRTLDEPLRGTRHWFVLVARQRVVLAAITRLLQTLAAPDDSGIPGVLAFVAGESRDGDFCPPGDGTDRYLSLLEALLTRVGEAVGRLAGRHTVAVRVCARRVEDPVLAGVCGPVFLHTRHLESILGRVRERVPAQVRLVPWDTPRYGDTQDPGFVFADFAANLARREVGDWPLPRVEEGIHRSVGVRPRSGDPSRTHLQAAGAAWAWLDALRSGSDLEDRPMRPWAREQALEWGRG